jgi:hypothetical protein
LAALPLEEMTTITQGMRVSMGPKVGSSVLDKIKISCLKVENERTIRATLPNLAELVFLRENFRYSVFGQRLRPSAAISQFATQVSTNIPQSADINSCYPLKIWYEYFLLRVCGLHYTSGSTLRNDSSTRSRKRKDQSAFKRPLLSDVSD